jgi:hypothetical protein
VMVSQDIDQSLHESDHLNDPSGSWSLIYMAL